MARHVVQALTPERMSKLELVVLAVCQPGGGVCPAPVTRAGLPRAWGCEEHAPPGAVAIPRAGDGATLAEVYRALDVLRGEGSCAAA